MGQPPLHLRQPTFEHTRSPNREYIGEFLESIEVAQQQIASNEDSKQNESFKN